MLRVRALLSTFNGEQYLREQLQSLADQNHSSFEVLIRDDGSLDDTGSIIEDFVSRDSRFRRLAESEPRNLGPCQSFGVLMAASQDCDVLFFCDQDDVWVRDKITRTLSVFAGRDPGIPLAVHSDLAVCDEELRALRTSMKAGTRAPAPAQHQFPALLAQNFVTGCTLAINQSLAQAALPIPSQALMHDWWIALIAATRGELVFLPEYLVLYRQHGHNASGPAVKRGLWSGLRKLLRSRSEFRQLMLRRTRQSLALEQRLALLPESANYRMLKGFHAAIAKDGVTAVRYAVRNHIRMDDLPRTTNYYALLLLENKAHKSIVRLVAGSSPLMDSSEG